MVELEELTENRFYKLIPLWPQRCHNLVDDIYDLEPPNVESYERKKRVCNGLLWLHMKDASINLICKHVDCREQYEVFRFCDFCGKKHYFEDTTCDNCEPIVINVTTWKISIDEANKAIKKINRAFKQGVIDEKEWRNVLNIQKDEIAKCQQNLERIEKKLGLSMS